MLSFPFITNKDLYCVKGSFLSALGDDVLPNYASGLLLRRRIRPEMQR